MKKRLSRVIMENFRVSQYESEVIEQLTHKLGMNRSDLYRFAITKLATEKLGAAQGW